MAFSPNVYDPTYSGMFSQTQIDPSIGGQESHWVDWQGRTVNVDANGNVTGYVIPGAPSTFDDNGQLSSYGSPDTTGNYGAPVSLTGLSPYISGGNKFTGDTAGNYGEFSGIDPQTGQTAYWVPDSMRSPSGNGDINQFSPFTTATGIVDVDNANPPPNPALGMELAYGPNGELGFMDSNPFASTHDPLSVGNTSAADIGMAAVAGAGLAAGAASGSAASSAPVANGDGPLTLAANDVGGTTTDFGTDLVGTPPPADVPPPPADLAPPPVPAPAATPETQFAVGSDMAGNSANTSYWDKLIEGAGNQFAKNSIPLTLGALSVLASSANARKNSQNAAANTAAVNAANAARQAQIDQPNAPGIPGGGQFGFSAPRIATVGGGALRNPIDYSGAPLSAFLKYGQGPEAQFFDNINLPHAASGGPLSVLKSRATQSPMGSGPLSMSRNQVPGQGGGQDDNVPAMLSPGEYVFDADTVAALGDGNNAEGARRLDIARKKIRTHKRRAPASRIPPKARSIEHYLGGRV